jgi:hypothetical protein
MGNRDCGHASAGREVVLNDDGGQLRGGLYMRQPWFGMDAHDLMPLAFDVIDQAVVLRVGERADRVWHFWSPSPRAALPLGRLEGCTVRPRVRISAGALLQMGMDYWRSPTIRMAPAGTITKPVPAIGIFPLRGGRKFRSPISAAGNSRNSVNGGRASSPSSIP